MKKLTLSAATQKKLRSHLPLEAAVGNPVDIIGDAPAERYADALTIVRKDRGVDGVLVCGCAPGECHYKRGTDVAFCKLGLLGRMLDQMNVQDGNASKRVRFIQIGTQDRGRIRYEVDAMLDNLAALKEAQV